MIYVSDYEGYIYAFVFICMFLMIIVLALSDYKYEKETRENDEKLIEEIAKFYAQMATDAKKNNIKLDFESKK